MTTPTGADPQPTAAIDDLIDEVVRQARHYERNWCQETAIALADARYALTEAIARHPADAATNEEENT